MSTPMSRAQLAEIRARRDAMVDVPWGTYRDLGGYYTVQAGAYVSATAGFDSSGDVARVIAEDEEQAYRRAAFIARAPGDIDDLLAEVERLRAEVERLHRSVDDQLETVQEAAVALAERNDELERLRARVDDVVAQRDDLLVEDALAERRRDERAGSDARPSRAAVLRSGAQELADRFESEGRPGCGDTADWCADELRRMADAAEQSEGEPGSPTPLHWGLDDAEVGDDDSVTLWLSGSAGEPYALELEPERAAALRELLGEDGGRRG